MIGGRSCGRFVGIAYVVEAEPRPEAAGRYKGAATAVLKGEVTDG
jgi:hypothetical protein